MLVRALLVCAAAEALVRAPLSAAPRRPGVISAPRRPGRGSELRAVPVEIETSEDYKWYILQCYVGNEVWCAATIEEILNKAEHAPHQARVDKVLVPTEKVASTRGRKVYYKDKIVYPGYVFMRIKLDQGLWGVLTKVPKVANFVGIDAGMRNGIGEIVEGYKGAVTPVPLSENEARNMLSVHLQGQDVGDDPIVDRFALGDVVAVLEGTHAGERGLIRSVKNDQLIVRLTGVGAASFDVPLDPPLVRHLTPQELAQMEQAKEMEAARAEAAAKEAEREAARGRRGRDGDDDFGYGAADAGLDARRSRRSDRRDATRAAADADGGAADAPFRNRERSRWETMAAASDRERAHVDSGAGSYGVDADMEQDDYVNAPEDDEVNQNLVSADDAAFFDDLLGILDDPESADAPKPPRPEAAPGNNAAKPKLDRDRETEDDALLRSLLSGDGDDVDFGVTAAAADDGADETFADFLGDDASFDALFEDDAPLPPPPGPTDAKAPGADDADDAELLAILGLGPDPGPPPLPTEPVDLLAVPDDAARPQNTPPQQQAPDYAKQTVAELKVILKSRGLKVSGTKAQLVDRLTAAESVPN